MEKLFAFYLMVLDKKIKQTHIFTHQLIQVLDNECQQVVSLYLL